MDDVIVVNRICSKNSNERPGLGVPVLNTFFKVNTSVTKSLQRSIKENGHRIYTNNTKWPDIFTKNFIRWKYSAISYGNILARVQFAELVTNNAGILKSIVGIFGQTGYLHETTRLLIKNFCSNDRTSKYEPH